MLTEDGSVGYFRAALLFAFFCHENVLKKGNDDKNNCRFLCGRCQWLVSALVLKVDGKYGVYDTRDSEYYDDNF